MEFDDIFVLQFEREKGIADFYKRSDTVSSFHYPKIQSFHSSDGLATERIHVCLYDIDDLLRYSESFRILCCEYRVFVILDVGMMVIMEKASKCTGLDISSEKSSHFIAHFRDIQKMFVSIEKYMVSNAFESNEVAIRNNRSDNIEDIMSKFNVFF